MYRFLCSNLRQYPFDLPLATTKNSLAPSTVQLSIKVLISLDKIPSKSSFLQAEKPQVSQPFLLKRCPRPLIIWVALHWILSSSSLPFLNWMTRTGHITPDVVSPEQRRGGGKFYSTCWQHFF